MRNPWKYNSDKQCNFVKTNEFTENKTKKKNSFLDGIELSVVISHNIQTDGILTQPVKESNKNKYATGKEITYWWARNDTMRFTSQQIIAVDILRITNMLIVSNTISRYGFFPDTLSNNAFFKVGSSFAIWMTGVRKP